MKRLLRPLLVGLLLWLLVPFPAVAQPASPPSSPTEREAEHPKFIYENFASWLFAVRPEVEHRPISLVLLWNMTDSVRGTILDDVDYGGLLTATWRNELLQPVLTGFLVPWIPRADGTEVQGDRLTMLEFRAREVRPIEVEGWTDRWEGNPSQQMAVLHSFPSPGTTDPALGGTFLDDHLNDALALVGDRYGSDNLLLLMVTDPHQQFDPDPRPPAQAKAFETFRAVRDDGASRTMTIYAYWNDFPDVREFLFFDEERASSETQTRWDRIEQIRIGAAPERFGDTETPPVGFQETLSVAFAGDGSGRVWSSPDGIDMTAGRSSADFNRGEVVSLTAEPSGLGAFGGFTVAPGASYGCGPGSTEVICLLTMDAARSVTVTFVAPPPFNWVPLLLGVLLLALIAFVLRAWLLERYLVRDERGLLDRSTNVFPGRSKRIAVPNPADPNEPIGHLMVARPLPFGFSRLRFTPAKGYVVTLQGRGRAAQRATSKKTKKKRASGAFHLLAGQRKPERHELRYRKGDAGRTDGGPMDEASDAETPTTLTNGVIVLSVQHVSGSTSKRKRKGRTKPSDANESGGGKLARPGRRSRRRIELTDTEEGAPG